MKKYIAALALLLGLVGPALAQWQVPDHAVPIGRGPGVTGFKNAAPGTAGVPLVSQGAAADPFFGTVTVPGGGTGATTFTSNLPLIGNGTGAIAQGTRSGNTTTFATSSGALTSNNCVKIDASGNFVDAGSACAGAGLIIGTSTVTGGTSGRVLYDNAGVVGEMTTSGSGTQLALTTSPTFITGITSPGATLNPTASSSNIGLLVNQTASGSQSGGQTTAFATNDYGLNEILVTSDNVVRPTAGNGNKFGALLIQHNYGGAAMIGGRNTLNVLSLFNVGASSASNNDHNYQAGNFAWYGNQNDGGTDTGAGAKGGGFALGGAAILDSGATNWLNVSFLEANVAVVGTATVQYKSLLQLASLPQDAVNGAVSDTMIGMSGQTGAIGWKNGILFGAMNGQQPLATTGCIICTLGSSTVATGLDISSYTITGNALKTPNFNVDGSGNISGSGHINQTSSATGSPTITVHNTTSDANPPIFIYQKDRSGGNTLNADLLALFQVKGFANTAVQEAARFQAIQTAASSGSNIPTRWDFKTSNTAGLLNQTLSFDQNAHLGITSQATGVTASACTGFTLDAGSTDLAGRVVFTSATSCAIAFGGTYTNAPFCTVSPGSAASTVVVTRTTTVLTATFGTAQTSMTWNCSGI
jgi:hypothetical protein